MADESARPPATATATVSSLKSEDSTEQLICKTPQTKVNKLKEKSVGANKQSVSSKSVEAGSEPRATGKRLIVFLGLAQVVLGALLVGAGAVAVVKGAALARVGAGLWAGCVAVVAGVVGVLAGINDCYGLHAGDSGSGLLTAFLALSLLALACGNSAAVLAATGLQRDAARATPDAQASFQDEMDAWTPVLTNIALLIIATAHCLVSVVSIYHSARRICPCFRGKQPYDHNQFDPGFEPVHQYVVHVDEAKKASEPEKGKVQELCRELEGKLHGDAMNKKTEEPAEFGSANSKERLVSHWLGRQHPPSPVGRAGRQASPAAARARRGHVRKPRAQPAPLLLLPAHPASTLGRMPAACVVVPPRYATLPLPPPGAFGPPHLQHRGPLYYPVHDTRLRRRRSPRGTASRRRRDGGRDRERDSQLARSLERIHRKRRQQGRASDADLTDNDLKNTYTGLDRAYAEQFIAVIDGSRPAAEPHSLPSSATDSMQDHADL